MTPDALRAAARALRDRLLVDDWVDSRSPIAFGLALAAELVATDSEATSLSCEARLALRQAALETLHAAARQGHLDVRTSPTCCAALALDEPARITDAAWVAVGITGPAVAAECRAAGFDPHAEADRGFLRSPIVKAPGAWSWAEALDSGDASAADAWYAYKGALERPIASDGLAAGASTLAQIVRRSLRDLLDDEPVPSAERDGEVYRALTWPLPVGE